MDVRADLAEMKDELIRLRRDFHRHPELGFEEHRTSAIVADCLADCGMRLHSIARTGVVGLLEGAFGGPTLLLRADMDAVPVQEQSQVPYRSVNDGVMHACGHDGHVAMLLGAARVLARYRHRIRGNIKFCFQPNEEGAGAEVMVEEGVLRDPDVDGALALHLWSPLPAGRVDVSPGPVMAASHYFHITVTGRGGHAGFAHESIDPILAAADVIGSVQAIQTRESDALDPLVIMACRIQGGSSPTVIPESVEIEGSIRFLRGEAESIRERFTRVVTRVCEAQRAESRVRFQVGNTVLTNHPDMVGLVKSAAEEVVRPEMVTSEVRTMAGEDFSAFAERVPSILFFLGSRGEDEDTAFPHHHPRFNIDEDVLPLGTEIHVRAALEYCS